LKQVKIDERLLKQIRTATGDIADMAEIILDEQESIFDIITDKKTKKELRQSMIGFSIIRHVSLIEKILKMTFIMLIDVDKKKYNANFLMNLNYLDSLRKSKKFTNGEILANKLNFQNFGGSSDDSEDITINKIFSEVLGYNFLKKLKEESSLRDDHVKHIMGLLEERHSIIHDAIITKWDFEKLLASHLSILKLMDSITAVVWLDGLSVKDAEKILKKKSPKAYEELQEFYKKIKKPSRK